MVGRRGRPHLSQARRRRSATPVLAVSRAVAPDRVRRHLLRAAQGRDPRLLRAGRRRPQRGHAGDLRHHARRARGTIALDGKPVATALGRRRHRGRHRLCAGGARQAGRSSSACRSSERLAALARHARRRSGVLQARARNSRSARAYTERLDLRAVIAQPGRRHAVGRQPAEGGHRQMAGNDAEGDHPRRADQGHRHRLQGRRARLHGRTRRRRAVGHHGLVGAAGDSGHVRPRRRDARGPHRRASTTTTGWMPRTLVPGAAGIAA